MAATKIYAPITKDPKIRGGKACIDGTRIAVMDIVQLQREGRQPEDTLGIFAVPLTQAQVHGALTYYYDHRDEIEACFLEEDAAEDEIERARVDYLKRQARP